MPRTLNDCVLPRLGRACPMLAWVLVWLMLAGAADAQSMFSGLNNRPRGPKTLLRWFNQQETEEAEEENPRIITDRPHVAEAASLVGLGRVQVETGYTYFLDGDDGTRVQTHSFPEPLFRIGMFREWFEFRFQYNYLTQQTDDVTGRTVLSGSDDIYLGAKVALAEQSGIFPEFTVFPQMKIPTGHPNFTAGQVLPGVNLAYAWMLTDRLELEANTQVNRRRDNGLDHYYTEVIQTFNFEYDLSQRLMVFHEFILVSPVGALAANLEYYSHPGVHIFFLPNLQLDVHAGVGLNREADNVFGGAGLSWRW